MGLLMGGVWYKYLYWVTFNLISQWIIGNCELIWFLKTFPLLTLGKKELYSLLKLNS